MIISFLRCEYCQILEPKYEAAAEELSRHDPPLPLAKINGDEEKTLYNRMGLNGYPTIFVYHNGRSFEYEGLRRTDGRLTYYSLNQNRFPFTPFFQQL